MANRSICSLGFGFGLVLLISKLSLAIDPQINGVFRISAPGGAQGTCFAIKQTEGTLYLGTAFHAVESKNGNIYMGYAYSIENDTIKNLSKAKVVAVDIKADLAVVSLPTRQKFNILPLVSVERMEKVRKIGFAYVPSQYSVTFYGYGSGFWLETSGILSFAYADNVYSDGVVAPGQSGGPAVVEGQVIGVISGGNQWYDAIEDKEKPVTWPARLGSARRLQEILDWAIKNDIQESTNK